MKTLVFSLLTIVAVQTLSAQMAWAKDATCKVETNDIGTIRGKGRTQSAAFEDAATQCFDRHSSLYKMKHGKTADEDTALVWIDVCANLKCSS